MAVTTETFTHLNATQNPFRIVDIAVNPFQIEHGMS